MSDIQALKRSQIFAGLSDQELKDLAALCRPRTFKRGDIILGEGEASTELYIIEQGMVEISLTSGSDDATPLLNLGAGQVFGEMSLIDRGARSATVRAVEEPTVVSLISHDAFLALCEQNNHLGFVAMRNLAAEISLKLRVRNISERMDLA